MTRLLLCLLVILYAIGERAIAAELEPNTVFVPMRDGIELYTEVYLPNAPGPFPTLVLRTPYDLPTAPPGGLAPDDADDAELLAAWAPVIDGGYAVVLQNLRGTQRSGGRHLVYGSDVEDGFDTVEWIAKQPWSNGKVGALGDSAAGFAVHLMAAAKPPALKAAFAQATCGNLWNGAIMPENGGLKWESFLPWMLEQSLQVSPSHIASLGLSETELATAEAEVNATLGALFGDDPQAAQTALLEQPIIDYPGISVLMPRWGEVLNQTGYRDLLDDYDTRGRITIPMLHVTLWQDLFAECTLDVFNALQARHSNQKLLVLNGSHYDIDDPALWPFQPLLDWFDLHLKDQLTAAADWPNVQYQQQAAGAASAGNEVLLSATDWPPQDVRRQVFYLHNGARGSLLARAPNRVRSRPLIADPERPQATVGGRHLTIEAGALEQPPVDDGSGYDAAALRFTSRHLSGGALIAGPVALELHFSSDSFDADIHAKLIEITRDGRRFLIVDNMLRARFRNGRLNPKSLETEAIYPLNVELGHIAHAVAPGSRLQLEITGSNFPAWSLNPNNDAPLFEAESNAVAQNRIYSGPAMLSRLVLPVIATAIGDGPELPVFEQPGPIPYCPVDSG